MRIRVLVLAAALAAGCGTGSGEPHLTATTLASGELSTGEIDAGGDVYRFLATCYDVGAGEVVVTGEGVGPGGEQVDVLVQAFFGEPYVGILTARGQRIEAALDASIDLVFDDGNLRGEGIEFVTGLELPGGEATRLGEGRLEIRCGSFERDLPPGFDDAG